MKKIVAILSIVILTGCSTVINSQNKEGIANIDRELASIYKKFEENKHDYGSSYGEARDTILIRFQNKLAKTLENKAFENIKYDSLSSCIKIITSKDDNLKIFSWDEFNGGTRHIYNSMYQFKAKNNLVTGFLAIKTNSQEQANNTDISHYKIDKIEDTKYLVKGYGTYGGGKEFYVYRLLSFDGDTLKDCSGCFNGEDRFFYEIGRGMDNLIPKYNTTTKEILYYELTEAFVQGETNAPSGFMKSTGKILKLKYNDGVFIATNQ